MKNFILQVLATIVGMSVFAAFFALALFVLILLFASTGTPQSHPSGAVLTLDLSEPIDDRGGVDTPFSWFSGELSHLPLGRVCSAIRTAATDDSISGLFVYGSVVGSWAQVREIRQALLEFRASKKPLEVFFPSYDEGEFYVASASDRSRIPPLGVFELDGLAAQVLYYSEALKKLGVEVQVTRVGKYKSAVEPFLKGEMSPENREQLQVLLGDVFDTLLSETAVARGVKVDELRDIVDHRAALNAQEAVDAKLIDKVASFDQVIDELHAIGGDAPDGGPFAQVAMRAYLKHLDFLLNGHVPSHSQNQIAVVFAQGEIVDGESREQVGGTSFARELRDRRNDSGVKAVVLRVDSPGGSAAASEEILCEVRRLRQAGKTVVVSMGGVAASGGYWISSLADAIVAEPNTITGSIGVFGMFPNAGELLHTLGVKAEVVKTGPFADWASFYRSKDATELSLIQRQIDAIYDAFLDRVTEGRKLDRAVVEENAQGRVWSGVRAKELGLVDQLGGLDDAIRIAAEKAGIANDYSVVYPAQPTRFEALFERVTQEEEGAPVGRIASLVPAEWRTLVESLGALSLHAAHGGILARLPFSLSIR